MDKVNIRHPDVEAPTVVPRRAYEKVWAEKGWREFDPQDPEREFDPPVAATPEVEAEAPAGVPEGKNLGADTSEAVPPANRRAKDGTPTEDAAPAV